MPTVRESQRIDFALRESQEKLVAVFIHYWCQWAATRVEVPEK